MWLRATDRTERFRRSPCTSSWTARRRTPSARRIAADTRGRTSACRKRHTYIHTYIHTLDERRTASCYSDTPSHMTYIQTSPPLSTSPFGALHEQFESERRAAAAAVDERALLLRLPLHALLQHSTAHHFISYDRIGWARTSPTTSHILRSRYPYPYPTHLRQPDPLLPEVSDPLLQHPSQLLLQLALRHDTAQTDRQTDRRHLKTAASIPLPLRKSKKESLSPVQGGDGSGGLDDLGGQAQRGHLALGAEEDVVRGSHRRAQLLLLLYTHTHTHTHTHTDIQRETHRQGRSGHYTYSSQLF